MMLFQTYLIDYISIYVKNILLYVTNVLSYYLCRLHLHLMRDMKDKYLFTQLIYRIECHNYFYRSYHE